MYLFLENNLSIPNKNIILIIDCIHIKNKENERFLEAQLKNKELINLTPGKEKSIVFTDQKIYISSYGTQTLLNRGNEFFNIIGGKK